MHSSPIISPAATSSPTIGAATSSSGSNTGGSVVSHHSGGNVVTLEALLLKPKGKKTFRVVVDVANNATSPQAKYDLFLSSNDQGDAKAAVDARKTTHAKGVQGEVLVTRSNDGAPQEIKFVVTAPTSGVVAASREFKVEKYDSTFVEFIKSYTATADGSSSSSGFLWSSVGPARGDLSTNNEVIQAHAQDLSSRGSRINNMQQWRQIEDAVTMVSDDANTVDLAASFFPGVVRKMLVYQSTWGGGEKTVVLELERGAGGDPKSYDVKWIEIWDKKDPRKSANASTANSSRRDSLSSVISQQSDDSRQRISAGMGALPKEVAATFAVDPKTSMPGNFQDGSWKLLELFHASRQPPLLDKEKMQDFDLSSVSSDRFPLYLCNETSTLKRLSGSDISGAALNVAIAINHFVQAPILHPSDLGRCATLKDVCGVIRDLMRIPMTEPVELREVDGNLGQEIFDKQLQKLAKRLNERNVVIFSRQVSEEMREAGEMRLLVGIRIPTKNNAGDDGWVLLGSRTHHADETIYKSFHQAIRMLEWLANANKKPFHRLEDKKPTTSAPRTLQFTTITEGNVVPPVRGGHGMYVLGKSWIGGESVAEKDRTEFSLLSSDTPWGSTTTLTSATRNADVFRELFENSPYPHLTEYRLQKDDDSTSTKSGGTKKKASTVSTMNFDDMTFEQLVQQALDFANRWNSLAARFAELLNGAPRNDKTRGSEPGSLGAFDEYYDNSNAEPLNKAIQLGREMLNMCRPMESAHKGLLQRVEGKIQEKEKAIRESAVQFGSRVPALEQMEINEATVDFRKEKDELIDKMRTYAWLEYRISYQVLMMEWAPIVAKAAEYRGYAPRLSSMPAEEAAKAVGDDGETISKKYNTVCRMLVDFSYKLSAFLELHNAFMDNASLPQSVRDQAKGWSGTQVVNFGNVIQYLVTIRHMASPYTSPIPSNTPVAETIANLTKEFKSSVIESRLGIDVDDGDYGPYQLWDDKTNIDLKLNNAVTTLNCVMYVDKEKRILPSSVDNLQEFDLSRLKDLRVVRDKLELIADAYHKIGRDYKDLTEVMNRDIDRELKVSAHVAELTHKFVSFLYDLECKQYFGSTGTTLHEELDAPTLSNQATETKEGEWHRLSDEDEESAEEDGLDELPITEENADQESARLQALQTRQKSVLKTCLDKFEEAIKCFKAADARRYAAFFKDPYDDGAKLCKAIVASSNRMRATWEAFDAGANQHNQQIKKDAIAGLNARCEQAKQLQATYAEKLDRLMLQESKWKPCMGPVQMEKLVRAGEVARIVYRKPKSLGFAFGQQEYLVVIHFYFKSNSGDTERQPPPAVLHIHKASEDIDTYDFTAQHFKPWAEEYEKNPLTGRNKISADFRDALLLMTRTYVKENKRIMTAAEIEQETGKRFSGELHYRD